MSREPVSRAACMRGILAIFLIILPVAGLSCKNAPRAVAKGGEKTPPQAQAPDKPAPGPFTECPEGMARSIQ